MKEHIMDKPHLSIRHDGFMFWCIYVHHRYMGRRIASRWTRRGAVRLMKTLQPLMAFVNGAELRNKMADEYEARDVERLRHELETAGQPTAD
jgi:hypothetical protein